MCERWESRPKGTWGDGKQYWLQTGLNLRAFRPGLAALASAGEMPEVRWASGVPAVTVATWDQQGLCSFFGVWLSFCLLFAFLSSLLK